MSTTGSQVHIHLYTPKSCLTFDAASLLRAEAWLYVWSPSCTTTGPFSPIARKAATPWTASPHITRRWGGVCFVFFFGGLFSAGIKANPTCFGLPPQVAVTRLSSKIVASYSCSILLHLFKEQVAVTDFFCYSTSTQYILFLQHC